MDWTVDTQVLYKAAEVDIKAIRLLASILDKKHGVGFDHEGRIQREYRNCARDTRNEFVRKWVTEATGKLAQMRSGRLAGRHQKALETLKFHQDDWVFVAVCSRIESKTLVAEESDYKTAVRDYLKRGLGVSVLSIAESLERLG